MSHRSSSAQVLTIMMTEIVFSRAAASPGDWDADDILGFQAEIYYDKVIAFGGRAQVPGWGRVWISSGSNSTRWAYQRGLMRDLGDHRRKQVWAAVLILEAGAGRVLRTRLQQLRNCRAIRIDAVNLSLDIPSGLAEELRNGYQFGT